MHQQGEIEKPVPVSEIYIPELQARDAVFAEMYDPAHLEMPVQTYKFEVIEPMAPAPGSSSATLPARVLVTWHQTDPLGQDEGYVRFNGLQALVGSIAFNLSAIEQAQPTEPIYWVLLPEARPDLRPKFSEAAHKLSNLVVKRLYYLPAEPPEQAA